MSEKAGNNAGRTENLREQASKLAAQKAEAEKRAEQLKDVVVTVAAKVAATGHLYGSVGPAKVAEELAKLGVEIDRKIITMREARKVGEFEATVHFHKIGRASCRERVSSPV